MPSAAPHNLPPVKTLDPSMSVKTRFASATQATLVRNRNLILRPAEHKLPLNLQSPLKSHSNSTPQTSKSKEYWIRKLLEMPPRSVCLNVFTTSLGEAGTAVREGREVNPHELTFGRRDSAQSLPDDDTARRSSSGSIAPSSAATSPPPAFNRADLFNSLRPAASTESLNSAFAFASKRTLCIILQEPDRSVARFGTSVLELQGNQADSMPAMSNERYANIPSSLLNMLWPEC
ncbi:hypothetical protein OPT61_g2448 [Boeremia exigua]|uniref:Uncharacterized protein n=1 Tax=Boeremia exigua TaxID=749465 RepID=A0ACC2ILN9_9PLEO|nr:hypothetical protein OPT61_g2448 [Boeremia exigua]